MRTRPPHICKGGHGPLPGPSAQQGSKRVSRPRPIGRGTDWSLTACRRRAGSKGLASPPRPTRHSTFVVKYLESEEKKNQTHICRAWPMGFLPETRGPAFSHVPLTHSSDLAVRHPRACWCAAGGLPAGARGPASALAPTRSGCESPCEDHPHLLPTAPRLQGLAKTSCPLCLPGMCGPKGRPSVRRKQRRG